MKKILTTLSIAMLLFSATVASSQTLPFQVTNDTGYTIFFIFISHTSSETWGNDFLGDEVILQGERKVFYVNNSGYNNTNYDIQFIDEDGDTYTFTGCIVENSKVTLELRYMD